MLLEAMDNKQLSVVLYLDMFKVLDSLHHDLLLQIIKYLGVSLAVHKCFKSYLSDRWQYTVCWNCNYIFGVCCIVVWNSVRVRACYRCSFYLIYTRADSMSSVPKVVVLNRMLATRKHFYRLHYRIWNARYSARIKRIYTEFLNGVVTTVFL